MKTLLSGSSNPAKRVLATSPDGGTMPICEPSGNVASAAAAGSEAAMTKATDNAKAGGRFMTSDMRPR